MILKFKSRRAIKKIKLIAEIMNIELPNFIYRPLRLVENELLYAGYNVIKVPGRIFTIDKTNIPCHTLNYMNAIVHINPKGELLVYITNKSDLNKNAE